ncbi:MAG: hypothetical protein NVS9B1_04220 [Candidatus Dormibacteraceae bacterium]
MHNALEVAQAACERSPRDAEAWWLLGCISRHTGMPVASDDAFARAAGLSKLRPAPIRVTAERFRAIVAAATAELSKDARRRLEGTRVSLGELPSPESIRSGTSPDAVSHRRREPEDVLVLFQVNLETRSANEKELAKLTARTLAKA